MVAATMLSKARDSTVTPSIKGDGGGDGKSNNTSSHDDYDDDDGPQPLCIPIRSSSSAQSRSDFVEIFPEEVSTISTDALADLLRDEDAPLDLWSDAALLYMLDGKRSDSVSLLSTACSELEMKSGDRAER